MIEKLNAEEIQIRRGLEKVKEYPHWRYQFVRGSTTYKTFLLYTRPAIWLEEVAHRDGMWMAGTKWRGTLRFFSHLEDALFYAERLANSVIRVKRGEWGSFNHGTLQLVLVMPPKRKGFVETTSL